MTIFGITIHLAIIWLAAAVIFLIVEALTAGLATIWFAAGAFVALIFALFDTALWLQVLIFFTVSIILLVCTRKIFVEKLKTGTEKTNVDALIGAEGLVTMSIEPFAPGQVKVKGQIWTAVGETSDTAIAEGALVKIMAVEGVKLIVAPIN